MYLEIKELTLEEINFLRETYYKRIRLIDSVYSEVCRIEADCSLERLLKEKDIEITHKDYDKAIKDITEEISTACEHNTFSYIYELSDQITKEYIEK